MQWKWVAYLTEQERRFPGVSATAHSLFSTLLFGLCRLATTKMGPVSPAGAFEMAKYLVDRMVCLREHLVQSVEKGRLLKIAENLLPKLGGRTHTARELVRKTNRLPIADCRDALDLLSQQGIIVEAESGQWQLAVALPEGLQKIKTSIIEV
jgi:hypothetical protein